MVQVARSERVGCWSLPLVEYRLVLLARLTPEHHAFSGAWVLAGDERRAPNVKR